MKKLRFFLALLAMMLVLGVAASCVPTNPDDSSSDDSSSESSSQQSSSEESSETECTQHEYVLDKDYPGIDPEDIETDATCTSIGAIKKICVNCGDEIWTRGTLDHDVTFVPAKPATCTEAGNIEHYFCSLCENGYADEDCTGAALDVVLPATGHDLNLVPAVSYCTKNGNIEHYACEFCDKLFSDSEAENELAAEDVVAQPTGHNIAAVEVRPATCIQYGYSVAHYGCTNGCEEVYYSAYTDETNNTPLAPEDVRIPLSTVHTHGEWQIDVAAGGFSRNCTLCENDKQIASSSYVARTSVTDPAYAEHDIEISTGDEGWTNDTGKTNFSFKINATASGWYTMKLTIDSAPSANVYLRTWGVLGGYMSSYTFVRGGTAFKPEVDTVSVYLNKGANTVNIRALMQNGGTTATAVQISKVVFHLAQEGELASKIDFNVNGGLFSAGTEADAVGLAQAQAAGKEFKTYNDRYKNGFEGLGVSYRTDIRVGQTLYYAQKFTVAEQGLYRLGGLLNSWSDWALARIYLTDEAGNDVVAIDLSHENNDAFEAAGIHGTNDGYAVNYMDCGTVALKAGTYSVRILGVDNGTDQDQAWVAGSLTLLKDAHACVFDGEAYEAKAPTCSETGLSQAGKECSICGAANPAHVLPIDPDNHSFDGEAYEAVAATCTETGLQAGNKCSGCGIVNPDDVTPIDPTNHDYTGDAYVATPAICGKPGFSADGNYCADCGKADPEHVIPAPAEEHSWTGDAYDAVAATCVATGIKAGKKCEHCGIMNPDDVTPIDPDNHDYTGTPYKQKDPQCGLVGYTQDGNACKDCDYIPEEHIIPATGVGHVYDGEVYEAVAATCVATGLKAGNKCSICAQINPEDVIPIDPTAHSLGAWRAENSEFMRDCTACGGGKEVLSDTYVARTSVDDANYTDSDFVVTDHKTSGNTTSMEVTVQVAGWYSLVPTVTTMPTAHVYARTWGSALGGYNSSYNLIRTGTTGADVTTVYLAEGKNTVSVRFLATDGQNATSIPEISQFNFYLLYKGTRVSEVNLQDANRGSGTADGAAAAQAAGTDYLAGSGQAWQERGTSYHVPLDVGQVVYYGQKLNVSKDGLYRVATLAAAYGGNATGVLVLTNSEGQDVARLTLNSSTTDAFEAAGVYGASGTINTDFSNVFMDCGNVALPAGSYTVRVAATAGTWIAGSVMLVSTSHTCVFDGEAYEVTAPTCSATGISEAGNKCSICGAIDPAHVVPIDPDNHSWTGEAYEAVDATCTETGLKAGKKCEYCGIINPDDVTPIDPTNHDYTGDAYVATPAICGKPGFSADGNYCADCGKADPEHVIPAPAEEHSWTGDAYDAVAATCVATGIKAGKKCEHCGIMNPDDVTPIDPDNHDYTGTPYEQKDAQCGLVGYTQDGNACKDCDYIPEEHIIPATGVGHVYDGEAYEAVAATCVATGLKAGNKCSVCGAINPEDVTPINPENHGGYGAWTVDATEVCYIRFCGCGTDKEVVSTSYTARISVDDANYTDSDFVVTDHETSGNTTSMTVTASVAGWYSLVPTVTTMPDAATYMRTWGSALGGTNSSYNLIRPGTTGADATMVYLAEGSNNVWVRFLNTTGADATSIPEISQFNFYLIYKGTNVSAADLQESNRESGGANGAAAAQAAGTDYLAGSGQSWQERGTAYHVPVNVSQVVYYGRKLTVSRDGVYRLATLASAYNGNATGVLVLTNSEGQDVVRVNLSAANTSGFEAAGIYGASGSISTDFANVYMDCGNVALPAGSYTVRVAATAGTWIAGSVMLVSTNHVCVFDGEAYETKAPTCSETGLSQAGNACSICGAANPAHVVPIDPDNHSWTGEAYEAVDATCTETGLKAGNKCEYCGIINPDDVIAIDPTNHNYTGDAYVATPAICGKPGYSADGNLCADCGKANPEHVIPAPAEEHSWTGEAYEAVDATCTETGLKAGKKCEHCGITNPDDVTPINPDNHDYTGDAYVATPATCGTPGYSADGNLCADCGKANPDHIIPPLGTDHAFDGEAYEAVAPTCTETGLKAGKKCSNCGITNPDDVLAVDPDNHSAYGAWTVDATEVCYIRFCGCGTDKKTVSASYTARTSVDDANYADSDFVVTDHTLSDNTMSMKVTASVAGWYSLVPTVTTMPAEHTYMRTWGSALGGTNSSYNLIRTGTTGADATTVYLAEGSNDVCVRFLTSGGANATSIPEISQFNFYLIYKGTNVSASDLQDNNRQNGDDSGAAAAQAAGTDYLAGSGQAWQTGGVAYHVPLNVGQVAYYGKKLTVSADGIYRLATLAAAYENSTGVLVLTNSEGQDVVRVNLSASNNSSFEAAGVYGASGTVNSDYSNLFMDCGAVALEAGSYTIRIAATAGTWSAGSVMLVSMEHSCVYEDGNCILCNAAEAVD